MRRNQMGAVGGILLDASVLLVADEDENGNASLRPGAENMLRKLHHSKIHMGISYGLGLSAYKVSLLERMARLYSFDCLILNASSIDNTANEIALAWVENGRNFIHVVSNENEDLFLNLTNHGWLIIILRSPGQGSADDVERGGASENSSKLYINKLEELPLTICHLNRKALGSDSMTVGYVMKPSRTEDFAKRGAFPLYPTQNGLIFLPLTFELPMSSQLQEVDIVLHKATDEIISIEMSKSSEFSNKITYTRGMQELERFIEHQPDCCVIDPLNNIYPVLDRLKIQQILLGLESLNMEGRCKIRAPHFLKVDNFNEPNFVQRLLEAKLSLPTIVKPQVACGVADAHSMAIVFRVEDYKDLSVPLPAVLQEYVDHSSSLFKFYVLGEKVFHAVKKSMPNADILIKLSERNELKPLLFDSLKSLPTAEKTPNFGDGDLLHKVNDQCIDLGLVTEAASWLRRMLDLTIFGFDVVIQEGTGDHVIVDVNYLPSFKEVPDNVAIPAFWEAIKKKYESRKTKQATIASS
uniref:Putative inositol-tetrakisphosphate 1-kinase 4 n=1 Tax=Davidia involucrata TaxID=16924 RepID=A0A5B7C3D0_DAVIN